MSGKDFWKRRPQRNVNKMAEDYANFIGPVKLISTSLLHARRRVSENGSIANDDSIPD